MTFEGIGRRFVEGVMGEASILELIYVLEIGYFLGNYVFLYVNRLILKMIYLSS